MKIKMKKTMYGTEYESDGTSGGQKRYMSGCSYEVSEKLGKAFTSCGAADVLSEAPKSKVEASPAQDLESKKLEGAPENKGIRRKKKVRSK